MRGWLKYPSGVKKDFEAGEADSFKLSDLLSAANTSLEEISDGKENQTDSMRFRGLNLMIKIDYRNRKEDGSLWGSLKIPKPSYEITVRRIPFAEYKITEVRYLQAEGQQRKTRLLTHRFGVKLHFTQTGQIARFSWNALVMEIVAGLTLLGCAQLIVDNIAYYVHPQNKEIEEAIDLLSIF